MHHLFCGNYPPRDCNALLLGLYGLAQEQPVDTFQNAALALVKGVLPFDAAIWGTATTQAAGIEIHTIHLHDKTPETVAAYEEVKHLDHVSAGMFAKPSTTQAFQSDTVFAAPEKRAIRDYMNRYAQPNFLLHTQSNAKTSFLHWLTFYREKRDAHCTPGDVKKLRFLAPHLMQALAFNRSAHLATLASADRALSPRGMAMADAHGVVVASNKLFAVQAQQAWGVPGAEGTRLPPGLVAQIAAGKQCFFWQGLRTQWHLEHDLLFIKTRPIQPADGLSAKESAVAKLVAQGLSHKEVARNLGRAPATVRNQIQQIYAKLGVNNIAELVLALQMSA
jgi:DNA-binding CsgD family transcriptional regulator